KCTCSGFIGMVPRTILPDVTEPNLFQTELGRRVRELRAAASMSQEELGAAASITAKYVSQLENGRVNPSIAVLRAIAEDAFGTTLSMFFNFTVAKGELDALRAEVETILSTASPSRRKRALGALKAFCS